MILEVCCGSVQDCISADLAKANRIELNSALSLGGLTPSLATFLLAKQKVSIPIVCMVRPRSDGFCYDKIEIDTMFEDTKLFLEHGVDGIVFGFLNSNFTIARDLTKQMVELCHQYHKEAVFHMAFDLCTDLDQAIQDLIECHVDRVLTRGFSQTAELGINHIAYLQKNYGAQIQIIAGCGIGHKNVEKIIVETHVQQIHGSFKKLLQDPTSNNDKIDYRSQKDGYITVDLEKVKQMKELLDD